MLAAVKLTRLNRIGKVSTMIHGQPLDLSYRYHTLIFRYTQFTRPDVLKPLRRYEYVSNKWDLQIPEALRNPMIPFRAGRVF